MVEPERISENLVIDFGLAQAAQSQRTPKKPGFTVRRMMILIAGVACAIWIIPPSYLLFDFMTGRRYLDSFSLRYQNIANDAKLLGRPEQDIVPILGNPTAISVHEPSGDRFYIYAPVSYFPLGAFHVRCSQGVVISIDPWDD